MTDQAKKSVLIVEDNSDNSQLVEKILQFYGIDTVIAPHGNAALDYCKTHHPDLILMDLSLPDIDGMEVTRQLRQLDQYKKLPIIAMTAHAMQGVSEKAKEAGIDDLLTKPFLPADLIHIVRRYLVTTLP
jgi:two-component system, cell cycle response regulator DivK